MTQNHQKPRTIVNGVGWHPPAKAGGSCGARRRDGLGGPRVNSAAIGGSGYPCHPAGTYATPPKSGLQGDPTDPAQALRKRHDSSHFGFRLSAL